MTDGSNKILGDILCIVGSLLYAASNVGAEKFVKKFDQIEYELGSLSLFNSKVSRNDRVLRVFC